MNIDLWVARDAPVPANNAVAETTATAATAAATGERAGGGVQVKTTAETNLAQLPAAQLADALSGLSVATNSSAQNARLLVVTEQFNLSDACLKLLGSMFNAIELTESHWLHAGVAQNNTGTSLNALVESIPIKAVVLMLQTGGNANALGQLRNQRHQVPGIQAPVMVTFHPQDLLDNPEAKRPAWEDLKQLRQWLP